MSVSPPVSLAPFRTSALPLLVFSTAALDQKQPGSSGSGLCDLGRSADCIHSRTGKQDSLSCPGSGMEETQMPRYRASTHDLGHHEV